MFVTFSTALFVNNVKDFSAARFREWKSGNENVIE